jgi:hypothetical protein
LHHLLSSLFQRRLQTPAGRRPAARPKAWGYRPGLTILEDRWLPSTIVWSGGGDGLWRTAANWAGVVVPATASMPLFRAVAVTLRVWDQKTQQARQITLVQDM